MNQTVAGTARRKAAAAAKPAKRTGTARAPSRPLNQAGRPTAAELARRKDVVMEIATELFIEHGFAATSLVDIAKGAGVATRTLYQHFGDKEAIFRDVIFARDAGEAVEKPLAQPGDTLFDALMRGAHYAYAVTYRAESIGLMRLMIAESTRFPEFMRSVANSIFARFRGTFEDLFQSCEAAGLLAPGGHARSAELFSDLILGTHPLMTYTNWDAVPPELADIEDRVAFFIRGRFTKGLA